MRSSSSPRLIDHKSRVNSSERQSEEDAQEIGDDAPDIPPMDEDSQVSTFVHSDFSEDSQSESRDAPTPPTTSGDTGMLTDIASPSPPAATRSNSHSHERPRRLPANGGPVKIATDRTEASETYTAAAMGRYSFSSSRGSTSELLMSRESALDGVQSLPVALGSPLSQAGGTSSSVVDQQFPMTISLDPSSHMQLVGMMPSSHKNSEMARDGGMKRENHKRKNSFGRRLSHFRSKSSGNRLPNSEEHKTAPKSSPGSPPAISMCSMEGSRSPLSTAASRYSMFSFVFVHACLISKAEEQLWSPLGAFPLKKQRESTAELGRAQNGTEVVPGIASRYFYALHSVWCLQTALFVCVLR